MVEFVERDLGRRSPWNLNPLNINSGNLSAKESRKQNRDRIEREKRLSMSSLGRVNEEIEQQDNLRKRRSRGKGRPIINPK